MKLLRSLFRTVSIWVVVLIQALIVPLYGIKQSVYAQEATAPETTTTETVLETPPEQTTTTPAVVVEPQPEPVAQGPQEPPGPDTSYTYNEQTGLWENQFYTWNPTTKQTRPVTEQTYSYNPDSGMWDTTEWVYAPESNGYQPQTITAPADPTSVSGNSLAGPQSLGLSPQSQTLDPYVLDANSLVGPGSLEVTEYNSDSDGFFGGFFNADISVSVSSTATTGNASVVQNTIAGSALTGNASAYANIMNLIQSSWGTSGLLPNLYTENIQGDYFGDIFLDPGFLSVNNTPDNTDDLVVNIAQDVAIQNDIELTAQSGNALVEQNTSAGNATSGSATALLNLINAINSTIAAGQSFVGMLNIYGNLEGDVLLPDNMLNQLLASNLPTSNIELPQSADTSFLVDNANTQTINNNIVVTAESGDAVVSNNTTAGDAKSGDASTSVTVFNLTGSHIIADQALLVFVNVMGEWVGFITNAPAGSNSALLGGGVQSSNSSQSAEYTIDNSSLIDNNISLSAATGSASVLNNTTAGSATTGDATAIANIANITNSSLSFSNWFGVLFINVFGNWLGSFGTNTAYGYIEDSVENNPTPSSNSSTGIDDQELTPESEAKEEAVHVFVVNFNNSGDERRPVVAAVTDSDDILPPTILGTNTVAAENQTSSNTTSSHTLIRTLLLLLLAGAVIAAVINRQNAKYSEVE